MTNIYNQLRNDLNIGDTVVNDLDLRFTVTGLYNGYFECVDNEDENNPPQLYKFNYFGNDFYGSGHSEQRPIVSIISNNKTFLDLKIGEEVIDSDNYVHKIIDIDDKFIKCECILDANDGEEIDGDEDVDSYFFHRVSGEGYDDTSDLKMRYRKENWLGIEAGDEVRDSDNFVIKVINIDPRFIIGNIISHEGKPETRVSFNYFYSRYDGTGIRGTSATLVEVVKKDPIKVFLDLKVGDTVLDHDGYGFEIKYIDNRYIYAFMIENSMGRSMGESVSDDDWTKFHVTTGKNKQYPESQLDTLEKKYTRKSFYFTDAEVNDILVDSVGNRLRVIEVNNTTILCAALDEKSITGHPVYPVYSFFSRTGERCNTSPDTDDGKYDLADWAQNVPTIKPVREQAITNFSSLRVGDQVKFHSGRVYKATNIIGRYYQLLHTDLDHGDTILTFKNGEMVFCVSNDEVAKCDYPVEILKPLTDFTGIEAGDKIKFSSGDIYIVSSTISQYGIIKYIYLNTGHGNDGFGSLRLNGRGERAGSMGLDIQDGVVPVEIIKAKQTPAEVIDNTPNVDLSKAKANDKLKTESGRIMTLLARYNLDDRSIYYATFDNYPNINFTLNVGGEISDWWQDARVEEFGLHLDRVVEIIPTLTDDEPERKVFLDIEVGDIVSDNRNVGYEVQSIIPSAIHTKALGCDGEKVPFEAKTGKGLAGHTNFITKVMVRAKDIKKETFLGLKVGDKVIDNLESVVEITEIDDDFIYGETHPFRYGVENVKTKYDRVTGKNILLPADHDLYEIVLSAETEKLIDDLIDELDNDQESTISYGEPPDLSTVNVADKLLMKSGKVFQVYTIYTGDEIGDDSGKHRVIMASDHNGTTKDNSIKIHTKEDLIYTEQSFYKKTLDDEVVQIIKINLNLENLEPGDKVVNAYEDVFLITSADHENKTVTGTNTRNEEEQVFRVKKNNRSGMSGTIVRVIKKHEKLSVGDWVTVAGYNGERNFKIYYNLRLSSSTLVGLTDGDKFTRRYKWDHVEMDIFEKDMHIKKELTVTMFGTPNEETSILREYDGKRIPYTNACVSIKAFYQLNAGKNLIYYPDDKNSIGWKDRNLV